MTPKHIELTELLDDLERVIERVESAYTEDTIEMVVKRQIGYALRYLVDLLVERQRT